MYTVRQAGRQVCLLSTSNAPQQYFVSLPEYMAQQGLFHRAQEHQHVLLLLLLLSIHTFTTSSCTPTTTTSTGWNFSTFLCALLRFFLGPLSAHETMSSMFNARETNGSDIEDKKKKEKKKIVSVILKILKSLLFSPFVHGAMRYWMDRARPRSRSQL